MATEEEERGECRAWVYSRRGLPSEVLRLETRPAPTLPPGRKNGGEGEGEGEGEEWIVVRVAFAGLNVGAVWQMVLLPPWLRAATCVPDMELSGVVVDVWSPGEGGGRRPSASSAASSWPSPSPSPSPPSRFRRGDKVVAMIPAGLALSTGTGALASTVALPARCAVAKPAGTSFADGAACLLAGMTARLLVAAAGLGGPGAGPGPRPERVLVNGASGGIGTLVVQMVRSAVGPDGRVVAVCSGGNADLVRGLGADEVIDYTLYGDASGLAAHLAARFPTASPSSPALPAPPAPLTAVIDTVGLQPLYRASPSFLTPGGAYASVGIKPPRFTVARFLVAVARMKLNEWWPTPRCLGGVGRPWRAVAMMSPSLQDRRDVVDMLGPALRPVRDSVWPFDEAREAYARVVGGHARGKVLVKVDPSVGDQEC